MSSNLIDFFTIERLISRVKANNEETTIFFNEFPFNKSAINLWVSAA